MESGAPYIGHHLSPPPPTSPHFLFSPLPADDYDKFLSLSHAEQFNNNFSSLTILLGLTLYPKWLIKIFLHPNIFRALSKRNSGEYDFLSLIISTEGSSYF